jgi:hypothetical protein
MALRCMNHTEHKHKLREEYAGLLNVKIMVDTVTIFFQ